MQQLRLIQKFLWGLVFVMALLIAPFAHGVDRFVKGSVSSSGNGLSWATAKKYLDEALDDAGANDRVFVAAGTYNVKGSASSPPRTTSFVVPAGCEVYGGFVGVTGETEPSHADPVANVTILTGDIGENDPGTLTDNAYHVITITDNDPAVLQSMIIDGFTIRAGVANGTNEHTVGGGAYIADSSMSLALGPAFRRCKFIGNQSTNGGGAIVGNYIGVHVRECEFRSNTTAGDGYDNNRGGGAISANGVIEAVLSKFVGNTCTSDDGGAIFCKISDLTIANCEFFGNSADGAGGAVFNNALCVSSLFAGNHAENGSGGGLTSGEVHGCTFADNFAGSLGGGAAGITRTTNSIYWGNDADGDTESRPYRTQVDIGCGDFTDSPWGLALQHHSVLGVSRPRPELLPFHDQHHQR